MTNQKVHHALAASLREGIDPSNNRQSSFELVELAKALNELSQAELDLLLASAGMSPKSVRVAADRISRQTLLDSSTAVVCCAPTVVPLEAKLTNVDLEKGCSFSLAREVGHGYRKTEKRMKKGCNDKVVVSCLARGGNAKDQRPQKAGKFVRLECQPDTLSIVDNNGRNGGQMQSVQDRLSHLVAQRDRERLKMDLDFD